MLNLYGIGVAIVGLVIVWFAFLAPAIEKLQNLTTLIGG